MQENEISKIAVESMYIVHKTLGPGLLENVYEECLYYQLSKSGLMINKQKALPVFYENVKIPIGFRIDLLIENKLIIEIKAVELLHEIHFAQVLTYLRLSQCRLGLLVNFNVTLIKNGIQRIVNHL